MSAEIAEHLEHLSRRMRHTARAQFEPLGITPALARALRIIGRAETPIRMSELADRLRVARRSATSVVDELAERGLVERCDDPNDRRAVTVELSEEGRSLMRELRSRRRNAGAALVRGLSSTDQVALLELLRKLDALAPPHHHRA
ncbi:MAG: MarR family transcriptional regulator [Acidimicrobiales bacterium]